MKIQKLHQTLKAAVLHLEALGWYEVLGSGPHTFMHRRRRCFEAVITREGKHRWVITERPSVVYASSGRSSQRVG